MVDVITKSYTFFAQYLQKAASQTRGYSKVEPVGKYSAGVGLDETIPSVCLHSPVLCGYTI